MPGKHNGSSSTEKMHFIFHSVLFSQYELSLYELIPALEVSSPYVLVIPPACPFCVPYLVVYRELLTWSKFRVRLKVEWPSSSPLPFPTLVIGSIYHSPKTENLKLSPCKSYRFYFLDFSLVQCYFRIVSQRSSRVSHRCLSLGTVMKTKGRLCGGVLDDFVIWLQSSSVLLKINLFS